MEAVGGIELEESRRRMGRADCREWSTFLYLQVRITGIDTSTRLPSQPFFWAFTTLALILHTWRIFTRLVRATQLGARTVF